MKKILSGFMFVAVLGSASASAVEFASGDVATRNECELLGQDVTLNLSKNVYGQYGCYRANNIIKVATCHEAGSRKQEQIQCSVVSTAEDGTVTYNNDGCSDAEPGTTFTSTQFGKAFVATTSGGGVSPSNLSAYCDSAGALTTFVAE